MSEKILRYNEDEGGWIEETDDDGYSMQRYYLTGNNVTYISNITPDDDFVGSLECHCRGLEHYQALNEIALLNTAACLDDLLRLSPRNLEFVKSLIDAELENR